MVLSQRIWQDLSTVHTQVQPIWCPSFTNSKFFDCVWGSKHGKQTSVKPHFNNWHCTNIQEWSNLITN